MVKTTLCVVVPMPGPGMSNSKVGKVLGVLAAVVGLVGFVFLDWRFDGSSGTFPEILGIGVAAIAVVLVLYRQFSSRE